MNLQALLRRLRTICRRRVEIRAQAADALGAFDDQLVAVLNRQGLRGRGSLANRSGQRDFLDVQLQLASLDLGQVEDLVDQVQQMVTGPVDAPERLDQIVLAFVRGVLT